MTSMQLLALVALVICGFGCSQRPAQSLGDQPAPVVAVIVVQVDEATATKALEQAMCDGRIAALYGLDASDGSRAWDEIRTANEDMSAAQINLDNHEFEAAARMARKVSIDLRAETRKVAQELLESARNVVTAAQTAGHPRAAQASAALRQAQDAVAADDFAVAKSSLDRVVQTLAP